MPVLRSSCIVKVGDAEFLAALEFPLGMLPLELHVLQVSNIFVLGGFRSTSTSINNNNNNNNNNDVSLT
jgi:hypothetical protein